MCDHLLSELERNRDSTFQVATEEVVEAQSQNHVRHDTDDSKPNGAPPPAAKAPANTCS